jgi:hypothetical protein
MSCSTPRRITPEVQEFCREVAADSEPVYLDVNPSEQDIELDCFVNAEKRVAEAGGSIQYGWRIWLWPHTMIEAEFHAVWRTTDDVLIDITLAPKGVTRILFLPDSSREYDGRQVNNIRKALYQRPLVEEFIRLWDEHYEILNKGERAYIHGAIGFTGKEAFRLDAIKTRVAQIQAFLSHCPCGSFKRLYLCCGSEAYKRWSKATR